MLVLTFSDKKFGFYYKLLLLLLFLSGSELLLRFSLNEVVVFSSDDSLDSLEIFLLLFYD